jgi:hypothetical protein
VNSVISTANKFKQRRLNRKQPRHFPEYSIGRNHRHDNLKSNKFEQRRLNCTSNFWAVSYLSVFICFVSVDERTQLCAHFFVYLFY